MRQRCPFVVEALTTQVSNEACFEMYEEDLGGSTKTVAMNRYIFQRLSFMHFC